MATLQDHARLAIFVDQTVQIEITSIQMTTNSGQNRVDLLNEGLAGFTPGSGDVNLQIGFAVPKGGQEYRGSRSAPTANTLRCRSSSAVSSTSALASSSM